MLILAFDTATDVATSALVWDGEVLGELTSRPVSVLEDLDALAAGSAGAQPVIDARRREVFALVDGVPACLVPQALAIAPGGTLVGDGAVRYRQVFEGAGAVVPADDDASHVPWARHHAALARDFGPAELVEPLYLRAPDADKALQ